MGTFSSNILPSVTGEDLGAPSQRWDAFIQNLDISGPIVGVRDATKFPGADIGAQINAAQADIIANGLPSGVILVPAAAAPYQFSTPIVITIPLDIYGQGPKATCLQYTPTTGTAINYNTGDNTAAGHGLHGFQLAGSSSGTGTSVGIRLNGPGVLIEDMIIGGDISGVFRGFHLGMTSGTFAYFGRVYRTHFYHNDQQIYIPGGISSSGENWIFDHAIFAASNTFANGVQIGDLGNEGPQVSFVCCSFDAAQLVNNNSSVALLGGHFEAVVAQSAPYSVTIDDNFLGHTGAHATKLYGTQIFDNQTITANGLFEVDRYGSLEMYGLMDRGPLTVPLVYLNAGAGGTPTFTIDSVNNVRTIAQLYSIAASTVPVMSIQTSTLSVVPSNLTVSNMPGIGPPSFVLTASGDNPQLRCYRTTGAATFYPTRITHGAGDGWHFQTGTAVAVPGTEVVADVAQIDNNGKGIFGGGLSVTGLLSKYNGIATVSNGVPSEYATVDLTAQGAAITTTTLYAVPASGVGQYRVQWNAKITTVDAVSSTLGALTIGYTDPDGVALTMTAPATILAGTIATSSTGNVTSTALMGLPLMLNCKASTNVTYAFAYVSNTPGQMKFNLHLKLEAL